MKRFLIGAGIAGAVTLAALFVAPRVIDWNGYRATLAAELSRATGRSVSLAGPIEATLLPSPRILANNVSLSGPESNGGDLLRLRAVELQVRLLPLLTGHIVVQRLTLVRPEILVETDENGHLAWVMDGAGGDLLPDVALQRFAISDGTLVWRDRDRGVRARIEKIALRLAADSLSGPAKAEGSAEIDGVPVRFTAGVGRSKGKLPVAFNVALEAPVLRAKGEFVGQYLAAEERITGRVKLNAGDARGALAALAGRGAAAGIGAALIAHPLSLEGRLAATAQAVEVNDIVVSLADQRATGAVRARVGAGSRPTAVEATFAAPRLDLDSLATVPPLAAVSDAAPTALPRDLTVALGFTSDAVSAAGKVVHGLVLKGALEHGAIAVERLEGQLPGAGAFRVAGSLAPEDAGAGKDALRFSGTIDAHAANLRDLLSWLDVDTGAVPAGRLANVTLKATLAADAQRAELSKVDLHLDSTRAHGTARIDYGERPGVAVDLDADHLDLDAYLGGDAQASAESTSGALSDLSGTGRFSVSRLTYRGVDLRDVGLTATLDGGEFVVGQFSGAPPEAGEFMPEAERPIAAASPVVEPIAAAAKSEEAPVAVAKQPAAAPAEAPPEPTSSGAENRDSFVRGILEFLGR